MKIRKWQNSLRTLPRLLFRGAPAAACLAVLILASVAVRAQQSSSDNASGATLQLFEAVMEKDLARVQAAVTEGADTTMENAWGLTATELAIDKGYFEIAHYLLSVRNFQQANTDRRRRPPWGDRGYAQPSAPQITAQQATALQTKDAPPSPVAAPSPSPPPPPSPPPTAQGGKTPPTGSTAATTPRPKVIIARVGSNADSETEAPPPTPSGQTAALPAKASASEEGSKDKPNVLKRVWSTLTDTFSFGGKEEPSQAVPKRSAALPPAAPKPSASTETPAPIETAAPTKTVKRVPAKSQPGTTARSSQFTTAPKTAPQPTLSAEAAEQGPAKPEPDATAPQAPRPEALAQSPTVDRAVPSALARPAPTKAANALSLPRRERAEDTAPAMNLLAGRQKSSVAVPHGQTSPKAAPEPASSSADAPRPEAPEAARAPASAAAPRPDQHQAASSPETRSRVPAKESQFVTARPGQPAQDAPRAAPAAVESTQVVATPAERAPAVPATARPVAKSAAAATPVTEAAPEPNLLSRVWSKVTESLGLDAPEKPDQEPQVSPQYSASSREIRVPRPAMSKSSSPPPQKARVAKAEPTEPLESTRPAPVTPPTSPHLRGVEFTLGTSLKLGQGHGPVESARTRCVAKNYWKALFCLEAIDWPKSLAPIFEINTLLYKGKQVIVRYDEGKATRFYALFPSESFTDVAAHFQQRYGPPTATPKRVVTEFGAPRRANPTVQWTSADLASQELNVLEIRTFNDASGVLPNFNLGVVELYRADAAPIFGHLYTSDLMILRMKQSSPHTLPSAKKSSSAPAKR